MLATIRGCAENVGFVLRLEASMPSEGCNWAARASVHGRFYVVFKFRMQCPLKILKNVRDQDQKQANLAGICLRTWLWLLKE